MEPRYFIDAHNEPIHHYDDLERIANQMKVAPEVIEERIKEQTCFKGIRDAGCKLFFGVLYTDGRFGYKRSFGNVGYLLNRFIDIIDKYEGMKLILDGDDLSEVLSNDKTGVLLEIEGTRAIRSLNDFDHLYGRGLRCLTITHNHKNYLGCGVKSRDHSGISNLCKDIFKRYEDSPLIVDLAHLNGRGFHDVFESTSLPTIVSHGNCYGLCRTRRNLTDEQIRKIAGRGGVIGVNFARSMLTKRDDSSVIDVVDHIEYIADLVGSRHVGIGSDFGGILSGAPSKLDSIKRIWNLEKELKGRGFDNGEIRGIMGDNFMKVIKRTFNVN